MKEKEMTLCIWIHHIATFAGLICGTQALCAEWDSQRKIRKVRFFGILLFLGSQIWAVMKIIQDVKAGTSRLRKCIMQIQDKVKDRRKTKAAVAGLLIASLAYKIFLPCQLYVSRVK